MEKHTISSESSQIQSNKLDSLDHPIKASLIEDSIMRIESYLKEKGNVTVSSSTFKDIDFTPELLRALQDAGFAVKLANINEEYTYNISWPFETKNAKKKQLKRKNRAKGREDKPKKIESKESSKSKQIDLEKPDYSKILFYDSLEEINEKVVEKTDEPEEFIKSSPETENQVQIAETLIETPKDQTNEYEILKKKEWESLLKTFFHDSEKISNWYKEKEDLLQPILKVDDKSTYEELTKFIPVVQKINEEYLKSQADRNTLNLTTVHLLSYLNQNTDGWESVKQNQKLIMEADRNFLDITRTLEIFFSQFQYPLSRTMTSQISIAKKYAEVLRLLDFALKDIELPSTTPELKILKENKIEENDCIIRNVIELNKLTEESGFIDQDLILIEKLQLFANHSVGLNERIENLLKSQSESLEGKILEKYNKLVSVLTEKEKLPLGYSSLVDLRKETDRELTQFNVEIANLQIITDQVGKENFKRLQEFFQQFSSSILERIQSIEGKMESGNFDSENGDGSEENHKEEYKNCEEESEEVPLIKEDEISTSSSRPVSPIIPDFQREVGEIFNSEEPNKDEDDETSQDSFSWENVLISEEVRSPPISPIIPPFKKIVKHKKETTQDLSFSEEEAPEDKETTQYLSSSEEEALDESTPPLSPIIPSFQKKKVKLFFYTSEKVIESVRNKISAIKEKLEITNTVSEASHVIITKKYVSDESIYIPLFCVAVAGKWILHLSWIKETIKNQHFANEEEHVWKMADKNIWKIARSGLFWKIFEFAPKIRNKITSQRKKLFESFEKTLFITSSDKERNLAENWKEILCAGGATDVYISDQISPKEFTHIFLFTPDQKNVLNPEMKSMYNTKVYYVEWLKRFINSAGESDQSQIVHF